MYEKTLMYNITGIYSSPHEFHLIASQSYKVPYSKVWLRTLNALSLL